MLGIILKIAIIILRFRYHLKYTETLSKRRDLQKLKNWTERGKALKNENEGIGNKSWVLV